MKVNKEFINTFYKKNSELIDSGKNGFELLCNNFKTAMLKLETDFVDYISKNIVEKKHLTVDNLINIIYEYLLDNINNDGLIMNIMENEITKLDNEYQEDKGDQVILDYIDKILGDKGDSLVQNVGDRLEKLGFEIY